jgi:hypothetical protein
MHEQPFEIEIITRPYGADPRKHPAARRICASLAFALSALLGCATVQAQGLKRMTRDAVTAALSGAPRSGKLDLSAKDLSGLDLNGVDFRGANLSAAVLNNTKLRQATLDRCNLTVSFLEGAAQPGCKPHSPSALGGYRSRNAAATHCVAITRASEGSNRNGSKRK